MSRSLFLGLLIGSSFACAAPEFTYSPDASTPVDAGADAGVPTDGGSGCDPIMLESAPADRLFLVDISHSWSTKQDRWLGATDAVAEHVASSDATYAMSFFPRTGPTDADSCEPTHYTPLDVPWGATKTALSASFSGVSFSGKSPLGEALEGAIAAARSHQSAGRTSSVILVTDATPGDDEACGSTDWEDVARIAADGFDHGSSQAVHVHVLSVIGRAVSTDHFGRLGSIAGTSGFAAFVNGPRDEVKSSSMDALSVIETRMRVCSRLLPEGLVPETMTYRFPNASEHVLTRVANAGACTDAPGFFVDDPDHPTTATVCSGEAGVGGLCELLIVKADAIGEPEVTTPAVCAE